jgi:serine phosphatase RsbU (regulator of sigma subunit)
LPVTSAATLADALFACANEFGRGGQRRDDMTLLAVRVLAADLGAAASESGRD